MGELAVDRLSLQVPGHNAEVGRRVANALGPLLAERLPADLRGRLERLEVRLTPAQLTEAGMSRAIADAIVAAIGRSGSPRFPSGGRK